jgi:hypothetical protein
MKYRKKPIVIEATQLTNSFDFEMWLNDNDPDNAVVINHDGSASIQTLEGTMRADIGDYIIKGVKGEIYPCKADIFQMSYELCPIKTIP